jgi:hypothetical protein|tara:strand:- start:3978 stop:4457 length:480 start_codon:yes stop_codon:yes gene_type:complete
MSVITKEAWDDYVKNLSKSSGAVWRVAMYLHAFKYTVTIPALHIAKDLSEYKSKIDDCDLILHRDGKSEKIEVKHQSWEWTSHKDIPWKSIIVCAKKSYDRHEDKPSAYFLVNKQLTHSILVPTTTHEDWWAKDIHDKKKDWIQTMYMTNPNQHQFIEL